MVRQRLAMVLQSLVSVRQRLAMVLQSLVSLPSAATKRISGPARAMSGCLASSSLMHVV
jgi:hypothetical protein